MKAVLLAALTLTCLWHRTWTGLLLFYSREEEKNLVWLKTLILLQKQSKQWKQKLQITFSIPNFLSTGTWHPSVVQSSSHPQMSHAQGLAVLLMITDCKINLVEVWFLSLVSPPPLYVVLFSFHCVKPLTNVSFVHFCIPPPKPLQEATKYYFRWLEGPARSPTCCKWHARNTRWNYEGLVFTKLGDLASKSSQMLSLSGNIFLPLF